MQAGVPRFCLRFVGGQYWRGNMKSVLSGLINHRVILSRFLRGREPRRGNVNHAGHATFTDWLRGDVSVTGGGRYRHRRLDENVELRPEIVDGLRRFVVGAHEDARRHFSKLLGISLDPLGPRGALEQLSGYPGLLHLGALKGYLGEILAGLICEHFRPFDEDGWEVPVFLFRFHDVAFHELERVRQTGGQARPIPGRFGTDCLAFLRRPDGRIVRAIFCEAKCTSGHDSTMIREAHRQLSDELLSPVEVTR